MAGQVGRLSAADRRGRQARAGVVGAAAKAALWRQGGAACRRVPQAAAASMFLHSDLI